MKKRDRARRTMRALTFEQAQEMRRKRKDGALLKDLVKWSGLSETAVRHILIGKTYKEP